MDTHAEIGKGDVSSDAFAGVGQYHQRLAQKRLAGVEQQVVAAAVSFGVRRPQLEQTIHPGSRNGQGRTLGRRQGGAASEFVGEACGFR